MCLVTFAKAFVVSIKHNGWVCTALREVICTVTVASNFSQWENPKPIQQRQQKHCWEWSGLLYYELKKIHNLSPRNTWMHTHTVGMYQCVAVNLRLSPQGEHHLTPVIDGLLNNFGKMWGKQPMALCHISDGLSRCFTAGQPVNHQNLTILPWEVNITSSIKSKKNFFFFF